MPYKRRKRYTKKFNRKRKTLDKRLSKLSKFVYKTIEKKQITLHNETDFGPGVTPNNVISDAQWTGCELTQMDTNPTGAMNDQRVGNSITIQNLQLRILFESITPAWKVRLVIVQFPNPQGSLAVNDLISHVLEYPEIAASNETTESHVILSPYKVGGTTKYRVLYDHVFSAPIGANNQCLVVKNININSKTKGFKNLLEFKADAPNSVAAYKGNVIAFWRMTDNNLNIVNPTTFDVAFVRRMTYRDA